MRKLLLTLTFIYSSFYIFAGAFTPGNLVVLRLGTGSAALTSASTAVYLDEYTPAGILVQSVPVPQSINGSNHALTLSGVATSEGAITLSPTGQYLTFAGFDTTVGYAGIASGATNRTIARVDASGTVNTSTGFLAGSAYVANNFRSAVTNDGNEFWTGGNGTTTGGVWYVPFGSFTAAGVQVSSQIASIRNVQIAAGQLYCTTNASGVYSVGTGLPTVGGQTETLLPGLPTADSAASPYAYVFFDEVTSVNGNDVLYIVDEDTTGTTGGIYKYSLVGGSWVSNGNIPNANGLRGLTGIHDCNGTTLYATAGNGIYKLQDHSAYNQPMTGTYSLLVGAANNTAIRGIAFTPGTAPYTKLAFVSDSVHAAQCFGSSDGSITVTATGGTPGYTYIWSGSSNTAATDNNLVAGSYAVSVSDQGGCQISESITVTQPTAITLTANHTDPTTNGGTNGSASVVVAGGIPGYTYTWTGSTSTTDSANNLSAGNYNVTVTDSHGCTVTETITLSQPNGINEIPGMQNFRAYAANGVINVGMDLQNATNISIELYDLSGKMIYHTTTADQSTISIQIPGVDLVTGIYIVRAATSQGAISREVLVKK